MHILHSPRDFGLWTNKTGAAHRDVLSRISPRLNRILICLVCSSNCMTDKGEAFRLGVSFLVLISWSIARRVGNSSGKYSWIYVYILIKAFAALNPSHLIRIWASRLSHRRAAMASMPHRMLHLSCPYYSMHLDFAPARSRASSLTPYEFW